MEGISLPEWDEQCRALRTRFKHEAELSSEYRAHAARTIRDIASNARARLHRQQATPFGHSAAYVEHLHKTLYAGFRFCEEAESEFGAAPDALGREILPAPDPEVCDADGPMPSLASPDEEDDSEDWPGPSYDDWRLEDGQ